MQTSDPDIPPAPPDPNSWLGCMQGTLEVSGDLVGPIGAFDTWNPDAPCTTGTTLPYGTKK